MLVMGPVELLIYGKWHYVLAKNNKGPVPIKSSFWLLFSTFYILFFREV